MKKEKKENQTNKNVSKKCDCEKLTVKNAELENSWKRALADYQNLEKRVLEEKTAMVSYANSVLLMRFLPVLDNLKVMQKHNDDVGLKMTIKEFEKVLEEEGVVEINCENKDFDANTMDALELVEGAPGKVVEIVKAGYMLKNKVLRPAIVKVGREEEK